MPETGARLRVLIVAPYLNGQGLGEVYSIFRWVEALAARADVTVLTVTGEENDLVDRLPNTRVIQTKAPRTPERLKRFGHMAKPWLPVFFAQARRWIKKELAKGQHWDIAHQILPQAMRYASPLAGLGVPYVIGPLGGSLTTPAAFQSEVTDGAVITRLRAFDRWRLRNDPWLRRGYENASLVLGVAPYIGETLAENGVNITRFEPVLERAHEGAFPDITRTSGIGQAHLLHVGRVVRTKGLRDVIRAMAMVSDLPNVHLTSAGEGPDLDACRAEVARLGLEDRVTFLGRIPRDDVDALYRTADVFCFPSFREPMGGVYFEAMEFALPVIAAARGGPDFILDDTAALKLAVHTPDQFAKDIADAIRTLAMEPELRRRLGKGAADRLRSFGSWQDRAAHLEQLYREVINNTAPTTPPR